MIGIDLKLKTMEKYNSDFKNPIPGNSMRFLGVNYLKGDNIHFQNEGDVPCKIDDEVIIHPIPGHSQATKSYPAKIVTEIIKGKDGDAEGIIKVLMVTGIKNNKNWGGAWVNDYLFSRLEFVKRNYKE